jgi:hypothetical protein
VGQDDKLDYPPIARLAHIDGMVIGRLHFNIDGTVIGWKIVSAPNMLSRSVGEQFKRWHIKTNAQGGAECQSLVITDFRFVDDKNAITDSGPTFNVNSVQAVRITVTAEPMVISDPAGKICRRRWYRLFQWSCR